jgi:integrase
VYGPDAPLAYLGDEPIEDIRRADLQDLIARLIADRHAPRTIEATIIPLRAILQREVRGDRLKVNPTAGLDIPHGEKPRDRIADPAEARALLAALPDEDRATWATATYAGLRRGELMALRANRIDLDANVVRVEFGWDARAGEIPTKNGKPRTVPIAAPLRELLLPHLMRTGRRDDDLVFGSTATEPFDPRKLQKRADGAWKAAGLKRITAHECRHTFVSYMIAAGVNPKAVSTFVGHASVAFTLDRYAKLFKGAEDEAGGLLDTYLDAAGGQGA